MSDLLIMAGTLRPFIEKAAQSLPDADGLKAKALYPRWEALVKKGSVTAPDGFRFSFPPQQMRVPDLTRLPSPFSRGNSSGAVLAVASSRLTAAVSIAARILRAFSVNVMVTPPIQARFLPPPVLPPGRRCAPQTSAPE